MSWSGPPLTYGDEPPVDPLRVVRLTPGQLTTAIQILDAEWQLLDRERPAMSPNEQDTAIERQQTIEGILQTLGQAL